MSKRTRITPELIRHVKEIKENRPALSYRKIAKLLWYSRKSVTISATTVGRILRDEYTVKDGKVVKVDKSKKLPPAPLAAVKQFQKVLEVTMHQVAEMSRENKVKNVIKDKLDGMEEKFCNM